MGRAEEVDLLASAACTPAGCHHPLQPRARQRLRFHIDEWREGRQVASALARGSGTSPSPEAPRGLAAAQRGDHRASTKPERNDSTTAQSTGKEGPPLLSIAR